MRRRLSWISLLWLAAILIFLALAYTVLRGCGISVFGYHLLNFCPEAAELEVPGRPIQLVNEENRTEVLRDRLADLRLELALVDHCPIPPIVELPPPEEEEEEEEVAEIVEEEEIEPPEEDEPVSTAEACAAGAAEEGLVDLYLLQDLSSSFRYDLSAIQQNVAQIVSLLRADGRASQFRMGLGSFVDKPVRDIGIPGNYTYRNHQSLTANLEAVLAAARAMRVTDTIDEPEAQLEALLEVALRSSQLGFRPEAARFVVIATDAGFHDAGDWRGAPRPEDGVPDGDPTNEDYPSIAQVRQALQRADIIPIFIVEGEAINQYRSLVSALGRGTTIPLAAGSTNLLNAIFEGIERVCN